MRLPSLLDFRWLVVISLVLSGCSLLRDLSADQCELDSDCDALPQFKGRQCVAGVCLGPTMSSGGGGDTGGGDSAGSSAMSGSDGGAPSAGAGHSGSGNAGMAGGVVAECTTNAECLDKNFDPSICMSGSCVPLLSDDCPVVLPVTDDLWRDNLRTQNPIIFGAFAYVPTNLVGLQTRNYDLALTEFTRKGLPLSNGKQRGLVTVVCRNNYAATANLDAGMAHLVDDLQVPGIIAALLADDVQHVFESKAQAAHVMLMSPLESDSTLVSLEDNGLIWQMLPGGASEAVTYAPLLDRAVTHLKIDDGTLGTASDPVRVALVTASDVRFLQDASSTIIDTISFNGKSASANLSDGNFKSIGITSIYKDKNANLGTQVQAVLAFKPHIIIAAAADEFLSKMVSSIESGWGATADWPNKPFYLLSAYHFNNPALPPMLQANPTVRQRMAGVNVASAVDQTLYNTYQIAFDTAYPEVAGQRGYENFYDAAYYMIYSAAAAGSVQTLSGDDLARGMGRLLLGQSFGVGQSDIPRALSALQSSSQVKIMLNGTDGPPTWDPGTGERLGPGSVWCVDSSSKQRADVLRYDDTTKALTGTFPCFAGF